MYVTHIVYLTGLVSDWWNLPRNQLHTERVGWHAYVYHRSSVRLLYRAIHVTCRLCCNCSGLHIGAERRKPGRTWIWLWYLLRAKK